MGILYCVKDLSKDVAKLLEINGLSSFEDGDEPGTTEEPTTTKARTITEGPTTTEEKTTTKAPTTTEEPTTTKLPTTTEEPTTTKAPTTTKEPTTTETPTTTKAQCSDPWKYFGGFCYLLSSDKLGWLDASEGCQKKGGSFLSIHSSQENSFIQSLANDGQFPWIGLTNATGILKWVDGTPVDYQGTWNIISKYKLKCGHIYRDSEKWGLTTRWCNERDSYYCKKRAGEA